MHRRIVTDFTSRPKSVIRVGIKCGLSRTVPEKDNSDSAEQNFQVHEKRHVFNVIEVVLKLR